MNIQQQIILDEHFDKIKGDYTDSIKAQVAIWEDRIPDKHPLLLKCQLPDEIEANLLDFNPGEIHYDKPKMLLHGMKQMLYAAQAGMQAVPSIRADMGCGIFPSLFPGIKSLLFNDGRMPWVVDHLTADEISRLREKDIVITDEFKIALEHMTYLAEKTKSYGTYIYPLDLQGPFDTAHIVFGDSIFCALYEEPDLVHHLLELSVYAINLGMEECLKIIPESEKVIAHYNELIMPRSKGGIKISEDTSTLLGANHIDEFVIPYMNRVLKNAGGGYIHYCGKNDYLFDEVIKQEYVNGLNLGNPEKHDMIEVLHIVSKAGKVYYGALPKSKDENFEMYFYRILSAATFDGKCRILPSLTINYEQHAEVINAWEQCLSNEKGFEKRSKRKIP